MNSPLIQWLRRYISIPGVLVFGSLAYLFFFQDNSVSRIHENRRQRDSLQIAIRQYQDTVKYYRELNTRLDNRDPEFIERVVRENHDMNMPGEDVYVFE